MTNYRLRRYFSTRRIAYLGVLTAISVVLNIFTVNFSFMGMNAVSFTYIPNFIAGVFLGPISGLIVGLLGDVLGCIIAPKGAWIPLITLASALMGLIPGLFFRIKKVHPYVLLAAAFLTVYVICTLFLNSLGIYIWYSISAKKTFWAYLGGRMATQSIIVAINAVIMFLLYVPLQSFIFKDSRPIIGASQKKKITSSAK